MNKYTSNYVKRALPGLVIALSSMISGAVSAQTAEGYWQGVQKAGVLRCGAAVYAPYVMRNPATGAYTGFFSDLCK